MSSPSRLVTGFNHNVKHKGQLFHVQTEDTGTESGHIVTHLFLGGNVLASKKTSYAELRGAPNLPNLVRTLMEEQHKEMLRNLVSGVYDSPAPAPAAPAQPAPPPAKPAAPPPTPETPPPLPAAEPKTVWPWSGKGRMPAPPGFRQGERASWPAGPKAVPPPLPPKAPSKPPLLPPPFPEAETLDSKDLVSDQSLDEVILRYLSGEKRRG